MSESVKTADQEIERIREIERRRQEYQRTFSYDGYKTIRKELFAHLRDPAVTITPEGITFNTACINSFEDVVYIKPHINEDLKRFAITPCSPDDKNALRWCVAKPDKRKSRKIVGKPFSDLLYGLMGWESDHRYKVMGFQIEDKDGTPVYIFDLTLFEGTKIVKRKRRKSEENLVATDESMVSDGTAETGVSDGSGINSSSIIDGSTAGNSSDEDPTTDSSSEQALKPQISERPKPQLSEKAQSSFGDSVEETNRMMSDNSLEGYHQIEFLR